eukprot:COSAG03_NODE_23965_length_275_cov_44.494318_1_plen_56_part_01
MRRGLTPSAPIEDFLDCELQCPWELGPPVQAARLVLHQHLRQTSALPQAERLHGVW